MLIEFFGRNFLSFRDDFNLSMIAANIDPDNERGVVPVQIEDEDEPLRLLRCAAIYGPNASGKSNVLLAAAALEFLLGKSADLASDDTLGPYEPFLLDEVARKQPVMLGLRAVIGRRIYEYVVEFKKTHFLKESLAELLPTNKILFERNKQQVQGPWTEDAQFELLAKSFRPNTLLLSLADRFAPDLARGITVGIRRLLSHHNPTWTFPGFGSGRAAKRASSDQKGFGTWLRGWLRAADTGVVDYTVEKITANSHRSDDDPANARLRPEFSLTLHHGSTSGPVKVDYFRESFGTRKVVELAPFIYNLTHGDDIRTYFVDELGASVHPQLLDALVRHLNCETAPESIRGQLIFATHDLTPLDAEAKYATLRRDQVYLTRKDSDGASSLYSLAEFKERQNLNLRKRYLHGRYGALPALGRFGD